MALTLPVRTLVLILIAFIVIIIALVAVSQIYGMSLPLKEQIDGFLKLIMGGGGE